MKDIKKVILILTLLSVFTGIILFSGCQKGGAGKDYPPKPPEQFETDVLLTAGKEEIGAHLSYHGFGNCVLSFTSPENLNGLSAVWQGEKCVLSYNNLSYTADLNKLPEGFFGKAALAVFDKLLDIESFTVTKEGDKWVYKGEINSGSFRLVQNSQSGAFEVLEIPEIKLTLKFENFKAVREE